LAGEEEHAGQGSHQFMRLTVANLPPKSKLLWIHVVTVW
jgi:hypothetical protein